jgi:hypothetical protein
VNKAAAVQNTIAYIITALEREKPCKIPIFKNFFEVIELNLSSFYWKIFKN